MVPVVKIILGSVYCCHRDVNKDICLFQPECKCLESGSCAECPKGCRGQRTEARDLLQLLAEIHFINAEVC